ncbi:hypothetical protein BLNAU_4016 [Blattamonas nauphoetae]|uniref:Uncharacterized protein n=1 Tax=Blattamonas nauphoetae TaxID=2049346 RepID=A0ABQ9YB39_9EUKA|nr:hypothetical protein BLNAU_4016 [Blattamonas nauphoetae]
MPRVVQFGILNVCGNIIRGNETDDVFNAAVSFLETLCNDYHGASQQALERSTLLNDILSQSLPSCDSLERCLKIWDVWCTLSKTNLYSTAVFLFYDTTRIFVRTIIPFVQSKRVEMTIPGSSHVSLSFGIFDPLIQKIVTVAGHRIPNSYFRNPNQFRPIGSFLSSLLGVQSLETRKMVLTALDRNLYKIRRLSVEWFGTDTTPFTVNSDGTLKEATIIERCSHLLTEAMLTIESLLTDVNDTTVRTLSTHYGIVSKAFSCLEKLAHRFNEAKSILEAKHVLQRIGAWAGSLINLPPSPTRDEAVMSTVQLLIDVRRPPASNVFTSLNLIFPGSPKPITDFIALINPLIDMECIRAKAIVANFFEMCSERYRIEPGSISTVSPFFNKLVENGDYLDVSFEEYSFHRSVLGFLDKTLLSGGSMDLNPFDTPPLRVYLRRVLVSYGRTPSKMSQNIQGVSEVV